MSKRRLLIVERGEAETYVLLSLVAFGATVVLVRLFLELSGYPQVGSSTLHIAQLLCNRESITIEHVEEIHATRTILFS